MEASQDELFFVDIPGIPMPVMPDESLLGKTRFQILEHYQNKTGDVVIVDDSNSINKIAYGLKDGRPNYSSIMNYGINQKLLEANKVSEENMREVIAKIDKILWQKGCLWAELLDCIPQKRGYKLTEGHDVALYRHFRITQDGVELTGAKPISLSLPKEGDRITEDWRGVLGATADTIHYPANTSYSNKYLDGLSFLVWDFRQHASPALDSGKSANDWFVDRITLLGNKAPAKEIVSEFRFMKSKKSQ